MIAVLGRDTNLAAPRVPSTLEISYLAVAADLLQMVADGTFPTAQSKDEGRSTPRVGDGLVRISSTGRVLYASPNAASAFHRLGWSDELVGADLAGVVREVADDAFEGTEAAEHVRGALAGTPSQRAELEGHGASAVLRALPLHPRGVPSGAVVLARDVTDVRRRDRALLSKDATIREIHHRVKNNLQTVAALLRLQARRTPHAEAQEALDGVRATGGVDRAGARGAGGVRRRAGRHRRRARPRAADDERPRPPRARVAMSRTGEVGVLPAVMATPLVMVLTELVANALEHGFAERASGSVVITATRTAAVLEVEVADDGPRPAGDVLAGAGHGPGAADRAHARRLRAGRGPEHPARRGRRHPGGPARSRCSTGGARGPDKPPDMPWKAPQQHEGPGPVRGTGPGPSWVSVVVGRLGSERPATMPRCAADQAVCTSGRMP